MNEPTLSRDDIRQVPCPKCHVPAGTRCLHTGKRATAKMGQGVNHFERMKAAQALVSDFNPVDDDDDFTAPGADARTPAKPRKKAPKKGNHYQKGAKLRAIPECPECGEEAVETQTKYGLRCTCDDCGLWSWDRFPLADKETHDARRAAHAAFDKIWKDPRGVGVNRSVMYTRLAGALDIPPEECHMKMMDKETARRVVKVAPLLARQARKVPF